MRAVARCTVVPELHSHLRLGTRVTPSIFRAAFAGCTLRSDCESRLEEPSAQSEAAKGTLRARVGYFCASRDHTHTRTT